MCVEGESPTTNNFLNTKAKALSCNEFNEPKGSLSIPTLYVIPNARKRAQHVKGVSYGRRKSNGEKRRDFRVRQGRPKRPPGDVLMYVEERQRRTDAAWREKIKFSWRV